MNIKLLCGVGMEVKKADQSWRRNMRQIRQAKLDWIINNIDVANYNPYNPAHMEHITRTMIKSGIVHCSNNVSMLIRSTETLVIEARKLKGIKR